MAKEKKVQDIAYNQKYPLMAFRLSSDMAKKVKSAAREQDISKSKVVKEALEQYFAKRASV
jgi:predicted transcriptional regulator